jgi:acetyltransferase-like isoleucine patch superfamily enzyme
MLKPLRRWKSELFARWALRKCNSLGKVPNCRALPWIENEGTLMIGDHFDLWSHLSRSQIVVGPSALLKIGNHVFINVGTTISATSQVLIGNNVLIGNDVAIYDSNFHGLEQRDCPDPPEPVTIEDDVWIATRAIILKGVTIGKGAVVAAGSVVTRSVPPYTLVGGVPAQFIRNLCPPRVHPQEAGR